MRLVTTSVVRPSVRRRRIQLSVVTPSDWRKLLRQHATMMIFTPVGAKLTNGLSYVGKRRLETSHTTQLLCPGMYVSFDRWLATAVMSGWGALVGGAWVARNVHFVTAQGDVKPSFRDSTDGATPAECRKPPPLMEITTRSSAADDCQASAYISTLFPKRLVTICLSEKKNLCTWTRAPNVLKQMRESEYAVAFNTACDKNYSITIRLLTLFQHTFTSIIIDVVIFYRSINFSTINRLINR